MNLAGEVTQPGSLPFCSVLCCSARYLGSEWGVLCDRKIVCQEGGRGEGRRKKPQWFCFGSATKTLVMKPFPASVGDLQYLAAGTGHFLLKGVPEICKGIVVVFNAGSLGTLKSRLAHAPSASGVLPRLSRNYSFISYQRPTSN